MEFRCCTCNMVFHSVGLLDKHKDRFCIGSSIREPRGLQNVQEFPKPEESCYRGLCPRKTKTPDLISLRQQRDNLMKQSDRREAHGKITMTGNLPLSKLTEEFQKLRMSVEESLPRRHTKDSNQWADRDSLLEVRELHEQKLAEIRVHTTQLEQQKKEIEQQLERLVGCSGTNHLEEALKELKEQEEKNEGVLHHLVTQINDLQGVKDAVVTSDHLADKRIHDTFDLISTLDGPLSSQIRYLQLAYMQCGGSDPDVLAHLQDLQAEAHTLEKARSRAGNRPRKRRMTYSCGALDSDILAVEHENKQLEEEILTMQIARERRRGGEGPFLIKRNHIHQIADLQAEISSIRREVEEIMARKTHPPNPQDNGSQENSVMGRHVPDPLGNLDTSNPAPYDPESGLVIFYDLVLGVDDMIKTLCLVAWLYSEGQEIGHPVPFPSVQCQPAGTLGFPLSRNGNFAILALKQPVHRMQPSSFISLVVEVQALGCFDSCCSQQIQGWTKLQLFDQHNQVQSGFWKIPVYTLPVRPSLSLDQLNSVPQLGNMELCLRVVDARDEDVQSLRKIDPNNSSHYKYPTTLPSSPLRSSFHQADPTDSEDKGDNDMNSRSNMI